VSTDELQDGSGLPLFELAAQIAGEDFDDGSSRRRMIATAAALVPFCEFASVTQEIRGQALTTAATSDTALQVDELQYGAADGPCLTAMRCRQPVETQLAGDTRWPGFTRRAVAETPVRAIVSRPLLLDGLPPGSVNFYGTSTDLLASQAAADTATGIVGLASLAIAQRERNEHLQKAMQSRETISAAVGIVMASGRLPYEQAFRQLVAVSQQSHRKLRDVADDVLLTGVLPTLPPSTAKPRSARRT
jgi:hypothetical protein